MLKNLFTMGTALNKREQQLSFIIFTAFFLGTWQLICSATGVSASIFPSPFIIVSKGFPDIWFKDMLLHNALYSFKLNIIGLLEAALLAIPVGFTIALIPILNAGTKPYLNILRFAPLTGAIGLFMLWFGLTDLMKTQFLAMSIFLYLVPAVVNKIETMPVIYKNTALTLNSTRWQLLKDVYFRYVIAEVFFDIINLAALSWTYIIVVETLNTSDGGVGAISFIASRTGRADKVFATLISIMGLGGIQDYLLNKLAFVLFKHKRPVKKGGK